MQIDIATDISTTGMQVLWTVPMSTMLLESLQNILLPLLLNIGCWRWPCSVSPPFGIIKDAAAPRAPGSSAANSELRLLRAINEEIVSLLPLGLLVHDQEANRTVISNPIADHLLPHLNLQNITNMADQHQG